MTWSFDQPIREHGYTDHELNRLTNHELVDLHRDVKDEISRRAERKRVRKVLEQRARNDS